jgi:hypothetical protein
MFRKRPFRDICAGTLFAKTGNMQILKRSCIVVMLASLVGNLGCVADVESGEQVGAPPTTDSIKANELVCTLTSGIATFAGAATVNLFLATGGCVGGTIITVGGTLACALPAAGTALTGVVAVLAGGTAWASCNSWVGPVMQYETTRAEGCVEGNGKFCRNLTWRYKTACGEEQFTELGGCFGMNSCIAVYDMLWRAASCKRGRKLMGDKCFDSIDSGHQEAIDHANRVEYDCKARYDQLDCWGSQGISADQLASASADNIVHNSYLCK